MAFCSASLPRPFFRPSCIPSSRTFKTCSGPLDNDITFQLRDGTEKCNHEFTMGRCGIDKRVIDAPELHPDLLELFHKFQKMRNTSGYPIKFPNDYCISFP